MCHKSWRQWNKKDTSPSTLGLYSPHSHLYAIRDLSIKYVTKIITDWGFWGTYPWRYETFLLKVFFPNSPQMLTNSTWYINCFVKCLSPHSWWAFVNFKTRFLEFQRIGKIHFRHWFWFGELRSKESWPARFEIDCHRGVETENNTFADSLKKKFKLRRKLIILCILLRPSVIPEG